MSAIYEPKGKAREYSPLALNLYRGCDHGCSYCYVPAIFSRQPDYDHSRVIPRSGIIEEVVRDARRLAGSPKQVLLSFTGDPYCQADQEYGLTRLALPILGRYRIPTAILTKGGTRCLRDLNLFSAFGRSIKVGATLTFLDPDKSREWEPGAALPEDRIAALAKLHAAGIRTWASLEPIIDPRETLEIIGETYGFVDQYKLGRWNHDPRAERIPWAAFLAAAIKLLRDLGKPFYVKDCLRPYLGKIEISPEEADMDSLALPPFPALAEQAELALA